MKLVINRCYGGFGLSRPALQRYAELAGKKVYFYVPTEYKFSDGVSKIQRVGAHEPIKVVSEYAIMEDLGEVTTHDMIHGAEWLPEPERDDPKLVQVVEELGSKAASGEYAELKVVEIPDGTDWEIEEYDGKEWIAEKHQTWL